MAVFPGMTKSGQQWLMWGDCHLGGCCSAPCREQRRRPGSEGATNTRAAIAECSGAEQCSQAVPSACYSPVQEEDEQKRLLVTVWNRERNSRYGAAKVHFELFKIGLAPW